MVALALAALSLTAPLQAPRLPAQGVLQPGKSLAGVRLGDTTAAVQQRWGRGYRLCRGCDTQTWFFTYPQGDPLGAGVAFRRGRVVAVFTLGSPLGWRTAEGLRLGEPIDRVHSLYGRSLVSRLCIGYGALSMRGPGVVTSIFTSGEIVYGFALTLPTEPVCR